MSVEAVVKHEPVRSDADLLAAFRREADEAALAELIRRHHRLVLGVCQQLLGNTHDAEDAYQATFLVLLRRSHRIRRSTALASWLYGVAFRVASRIRQRRARMKPLEFEPLVSMGEDPLTAVMLRDQQAALHAAIVRLPEKLRRPVVLRYLLGQSNLDVAEQLAISEAAVEGRIKRAKARLRRQLTKQGMTMTAALATLPLAAGAIEASEPLIALTVRSCLIARAGGCTAAGDGGMPRPLTDLVTEEMTSMFARHFTQVAVALVGISAAATGLMLLPQITQAQQAGETPFDPFAVPQQQQPAETPAVTVQVAPARSTDVPRAELSLSARPASEQRILEQLEQTTSIEFFDEPLAHAVSYFEEVHGIQIEVDQAALDELGISTDATVNKQLSGISLRSALNLMLRDLGLTYDVRDEVLVITTPEAAGANVFLRLYPYRAEWPMTLKQLAEAIEKGIAPDTWDDVGGEGIIYEYNDGLMISQTQDVHEQVVDLLMMLSRQAKQKAAK